VFPHLRSLDDPLQLEEERRLAYVGITRARRHLYVTHAWSRTLWGSTSHAIPSRFLSEIPAELVRDVGASALSRPDPTRLTSARFRRRPERPDLGSDSAGDEDTWSVAADRAHDEDAWHDPDPWADDTGDTRPPAAPVQRDQGRPRTALPPRQPTATGRKSRLPKMAEERFRTGP
jgi:ATP-dependent exoDNAse (exonuclease V) beta subunit